MHKKIYNENCIPTRNLTVKENKNDLASYDERTSPF